MLVVCKDNTTERGGLLSIDKTYFVEDIECVDNQFYYKLKGFNTLFCYWNFDVVSEIRDKKLNDLGI
jgi:hypothetical protein